MNIYIAIYIISISIQLGTAIATLSTMIFLRKYHFGYMLLALGFLLMIGRRVTPVLNNHIVPLDAYFSLGISLLLFFGMLTIRKITKDLYLNELKLQKLLQYDFLTNVFSRSEILYRGHIELERARRSHLPLGILILDIDHFKMVNDQYGHEVGDTILSNLTKYCSKKLREIDLIGRIGGEEFLILLPNTNLKAAEETAERIRHFIELQHHVIEGGQIVQVTVSIGATAYSPEIWRPNLDLDAIFQSLLKTADKAMYQAKENGRNTTKLLPSSS